MQLEAYLDFISDRDIRLAGTRVGIETVLLAYLDDKLSAEEIAAQYPSVTLEQVYGAILYYLHYRERMDAYLEAFIVESRERQEAQDSSPSALVNRLRAVERNRLHAAV